MSVLCDFLQDGYCSKYTYNQAIKIFTQKLVFILLYDFLRLNYYQ